MHCFQRQAAGSVPNTASCTPTALRNSSHLLHKHTSQRTALSIARQIVCHAKLSLEDVQRDAEAGPSLSSINKLDLTSAMMLANLMRPPKEQYTGPAKTEADNDDTLILDGTERPNDPLSVADFVQALEVVVRSSNNDVNPEQLAEIMDDLLQQGLIPTFTPQQLGSTLKNLAVICSFVPVPILDALLHAVGQQMSAFSIQQLSNVCWALMRLMPVAHEQLRESFGMDQHWLQQFHTACEQQLQQVVQQQAPMPATQQLANLLLIPAAVEQPFSAACQQVFEQAAVMSQQRLSGMAAAQLFTCYLGLEIRPGQELLSMLLQHLEEDYLLYDYDELTQVAVGVYSLQVQLPNRVLADITERCEMLEASGQADQDDIELMKECLSRLAKAAMVTA